MTAQPAEQLVGRAAELGSLDDGLAELERRRFVALELVGEPGIGKSSLLAELGARADARGQIVLSGTAAEFERDLPFGIFADALDDYVQALEPRRLDAVPEEVRAELVHVLPSLAAPAAGSTEPQDHRFRTHRAVRTLLEVLAATKPLVLLLDDVHWADSGSVELLGSLLRRPPAAAVLIAVAVRPRQQPERLSAALERARRTGALTRLELGALSEDDSRRLLGDGVGGAAAAALHQQSGGNPFYLRQLARSLDRPDGIGAGAGVALTGAVVPRKVAAALTEELAVLEPGARRVLEGAAVAGDPFEPELAAAAAGASEESAMDALDELLEHDLVRATNVPRRFRFRHPLVRGAVYGAAPGGWRLGAHERCAELLASRGAPAAARAHHVEHAARHGDTDAVAVLREAGEAVAQRTPAGAARWFEAALRLLPAEAPPEERIALLDARAGALAAIGQFADAHAALLESIRVAPRDAGALRVQLTASCAGVDQLLGRHEDARARLERALEELADPASPDHVTLKVALAGNAVFLQQYESARAWAEDAREAARSLGQQGLIAEAAAMLSLACAFLGQVEVAQRHRAEAARIIDAMPDAELAPHVNAIANLFAAELYLDRFGDGVAHAERGVAVARATGQGQLFPALVPLLGSLLVMQGRLAEAAEHEDGAIEAARLAGNDQALAWALFHRAFAALYAGDLDTALAAGQESVDLTRASGESVASCFAGLVLGMALVEHGDAVAGVDLMVASAGGEDLPRIPGAWRAYYLDRLTQGLLAAGRRETAERAAAAAAAIADATGLRFAAMTARRAAARVALDSDARTAAEHAHASAAAAEAIAAPVEAAMSRALAGIALARAGEPGRAVAELTQAAAELDALGAVRHRDAAERELRRLGQRNLHRRTRAGRPGGTGIESLTERELQIARLVVDRRTNPQIAAELFLSQKTVETHIRNLFGKLDVSSRVEVARVVGRADRVT